MTWTLTADAEEFVRSAVPRLAERPVDNTLVLTIIEWLRAGNRHSDRPVVLGWDDNGPALGAVLMTPPFEMILAQVEARAVAALVEALREREVDVPGVTGDVDVVDAFAASWRAGTSLQQRTVRLQRLYKLNRLLDPSHPPAGRARLATMADLAVVVGWLNAFYLEAGLPESEAEAVVAGRIADNRLWLWDDAAGVPVSFAGRQQTAAGVARIGPVYTPPEQRRRGYGAGATAACTADALRRDARDVALFTDLANPTSNAIYQQIGFEPVADSKVVRFEPPA